MLFSLVLLLLLTVGGFALTYLFADDESFLWRACAGCVVGSSVFGLICFLAACFFGFSPAVVSLSYLLTLSPLAVFARKDYREKFLIDWRAALKNLEGADFNKFLRFAYYIFFLALFWFFFQRAMLETTGGAIFIGSSHNLGDLPFHLGAIFSFTDGQNFPPENPSFAFAKFTYPFIVDLIAASFMSFGARASDALLAQNVFLAFSLLVVFERFVFKFTGSRAAGKIAPALLFFCGGVGFLWFFKDAFIAPEGIYNFLWHLPIDYTIREEKFHFGNSLFSFRWGDSLTTLFLTQRSLLLGMPLTIIVLQKIREIFNGSQRSAVSGQKSDEENTLATHHFPLSTFFVGLLAGTLPLVHTHSLAVLFFVCACLFFFSLGEWRAWLAFGFGVAVVAVPELLWAMSGSATRFDVFAAWHFGWDSRGENIFAFWARNLGIFIPLLIAGIYFVVSRADEKTGGEKIHNSPFSNHHLIFYVPFLLLFIICNVARLAPWEWDNIKILIYWFVGSIPFVALFLARLWENKAAYKFVAAAFFIVLTLTGAIDVWRVCSRAINYEVFPADSVKLAEQIKQKTAPRAMFLNAPTFNSAVVLSGRRSLMRYTGHLSSYGIDFEPRETEVKRIYEGSALAESLLKKYGIEYVVVSPAERDYCKQNNVQLDEEYFRRFPVAAEVGDYRVYKVR